MSRKILKKVSRSFFELYKSSAGKKIFPRAMENEESFEDYLPYAFLLDDDRTIQTKNRQLIQCIRLNGINASTSSHDKIDSLKNLFASIIAKANDEFSYYVHKVSKELKYKPRPIESNRFAYELDNKWISYLQEKARRDISITISLISKPSLLLKATSLVNKLNEMVRGDKIQKSRFESYKTDILERLLRLNELSSIIMATFSDHNARILLASSGELLGFLESIGCGTEIKTYPSSDEYAILARSVANYRPTMIGTNIFISGGTVNDRIGRIFTIKDYPRTSYAGIFDELSLPIDIVVTNSFSPISDNKAKEILRRTLAQRASIGETAFTDRRQMEKGQDKIASGLERLGYHHMTIAIYADNKDIIERASAEIRSIAQEVGAKIIVEVFAGPGHYFSQWPGNAEFRSRTGLISNYAFAGMAAFHRMSTGLSGDEVPWQTPITAFPTTSGGLYKFNFHPRGRPVKEEEPPAAHAAIFGDMGSGKTVLINFFAAQIRRNNIQTFLFDYRQGMKVAVKALSGIYTTISPKVLTGLNPLFVETDREGCTWLNDWLIALLDRDNNKFTPLQHQAISNAINQNANAPDHLRNFKNFSELFAHIDDEGDLLQRIREWCTNGRYGWIFGENETEQFILDNPIMGFDMTTVLDSGHEKEKTAILGYLFRQIEKKLQKKIPSLVIIDEAWSALNTDYFAQKIQNWLVTVRKLNAVVVLVTQFPSQLMESRLGPLILQAIRTQIILPNRNAKAENYQSIGLNNRELQTVLNTPIGTRLALIRNETESVVVNLNLSSLGDYLSILGGGPAGEKMFKKYKERGICV